MKQMSFKTYRNVCLFVLGVLLLVFIFRSRKEGFIAAGTWSKSCNLTSDSNNVLTANCKNRSGKYKSSTLNYGKCKDKKVTNDDGNLKCGLN